MKSAYIINLSNGGKIKIDADEMPKLINGMGRGSIIIFRQGIVNPSYVISVVQDELRIKKYRDDVIYYNFNVKEHSKLYPERVGQKPQEKLPDIFKNLEIKKLLTHK